MVENYSKNIDMEDIDYFGNLQLKPLMISE